MICSKVAQTNTSTQTHETKKNVTTKSKRIQN